MSIPESFPFPFVADCSLLPCPADRILPLVAKCMVPGDGFAGYTSPDIQAVNEVNMYTKVLPFFSRLCAESGVPMADLFPR